jgi:hypothetical protein
VTGIDLQGTVMGLNHHPAFLSPITEMEDVRLDGRQEGLLSGVIKEGPFPEIAMAVDQIEEISSLGAQGGEKAVSLLQVKFFRREVNPVLPAGYPGDFPVGKDIPPVFPAGIHEKEIHIHRPGQGGEYLDVKGGQGGYAEDGDAFRKGRERRLPLNTPEKGLLQGGRVLTAPFRYESAPQVGLPVVFCTPLPTENHIGPEEEIMIEDGGDPGGQLDESDFPVRNAKIALKCVEARAGQ